MGMFADKLVEKTLKEYSDFQNIRENKTPLKERIGLYWDFVDRPELDGGDNVPWSAAFISYMVNLAGAGTQFRYSAQHSVYLYRTINDRITQRPTPFWAYRPDELTISPGDIIGMNRGTSSPIDYDWAAFHSDYASHCDIVVKVDAGGKVYTVGGNVGRAPGEIGRKTFTLSGGTLTNNANAGQQGFAVIRSFLP
jgi:hypothetical protein